MIRNPRAFLAVEILGAGILSALFLNDTICLMFTPFLIGITDSLKRNPLPYLIALATASNVGSAATLIGNPQNMIIGIASGISYLDFLLSLAPVALLGMAVIWLVLVLLYPREFNRGGKLLEYADETKAVNKPLLVKTLLVTAALPMRREGRLPVSCLSPGVTSLQPSLPSLTGHCWFSLRPCSWSAVRSKPAG